ncbi:MAG: type II/IV secretion system protein [Gemmatimonadaceae bacterium]|nr:type II/IV secretion system protein [Gemmatimonadaceae bacterium]
MSPALAVNHTAADFTRVDPRAVALLAERWARRHAVLPLAVEGGEIVVATSDPLDLDAERALSFATGHRVRWAVASPVTIAEQLDRWYGDGARPDADAPPVAVEHLGFSENAAARGDEPAASIIRLVDQLIAEGIGAGASDIHVESEEQGIAVRHRIDGVLRQVRTLPRALAPSLVSRVKILSGLDIADRLRPQDGRARVAVRGTVVDLRVSTLPASHGEKIVVRVLDGSGGLRSLDAIGFAPADLGRIRLLLEQREGLILVTGPTGSGKTTTLYAALREIQARGVNVVTVEDPIEYRLPGIVQVQVHDRAGLTFGAALRSIMRQDPDVILVGEIRDRETAEIAIQASLTGHLVLSTLHTNDAASAVTRLIDIGVPSYQIATAVKGVIAQRLLRRGCASCSAAGCDECGGTGYRGRLAVAEILISSPEFERRVADGAPTEELTRIGRASGCVSVWEAGLSLVRRELTTIDELRRIAAEPARQVTEPSRRAQPEMMDRGRLIIAVLAGTLDDDLLRELRGAVTLLGEHVALCLVELDELAVTACSAVIVSAIAARAVREAAEQRAPRPLVAALANDVAGSEHVRLLARDSDLVMPRDTAPRLLVATVLALVRWRG